MLNTASILATSAATYMGVVVVAASQDTNPYLTVGLAGVLLGAIVVPSFRWQQKQIERLMLSLEATVKAQTEHHESEDIEHKRITTLLTQNKKLLEANQEEHEEIIRLLGHPPERRKK